MNDLTQRLKDGVPTPPDPTDLSLIATRAAAVGRRRRAQRRLGSVAAVALLAVGGVLLPRVLADEPPDVAERSEPQCVASADAPLEEIATQEATWVRFCDLADPGAAQRARFPRGAVTGGLATAVVQGWSDWVLDSDCGKETPPVPSRLFRIQVGLADGSVAEIEGDTGCTDGHLLFIQMETPLILGIGTRRDEVVQPREVTCPEVFGTTETSWGGDDKLFRDDAEDPSLSSAPFLPGQVSASDVCAYKGSGDRRTLVDQWQVDPIVNIRSDAATGYEDGVADCDTRPDATSYLVVLQDFTGTARTFTLDMTACGEMYGATGVPPVETYLGLASDQLVRTVRGSKP